MDKLEELRQSFQTEIDAVSAKEIAEVEEEIEAIRMRTTSELERVAKANAEVFYRQELDEIQADHAIALSHLNDENNKLLMKERDQLVESVFEEAKEQLLAFASSEAYIEKIKSKLNELKSKGLTPATLYVRPTDEKLLKSFLKAYELNCEGKIDDTIILGGFRLVCASKGVIVDETYDMAMQEAKQWFLQNSGLTIR